MNKLKNPDQIDNEIIDLVNRIGTVTAGENLLVVALACRSMFETALEHFLSTCVGNSDVQLFNMMVRGGKKLLINPNQDPLAQLKAIPDKDLDSILQGVLAEVHERSTRVKSTRIYVE